MSQTTAAVGVHWWTAATTKTILDVKSVLGDLGPAETPGGFGQPTFRCHESGTRVYCGSERADQPIVINAGGEVCEGWWQHLARCTDDLGGWVTRWDMASDVEPPSEARRRLRQMDSAFRRGKCDTALRARHLHQSDDGWTLYLGGKSSPLMMRAYDQRGPLRIEMQYRPASRDVGESLASRLLKRGPAYCWRMHAQAAVFPMGWYRDLLDGDAEILPSEERTTAALDDVVQQLRKQWGSTLWALDLLGMTLKDLQHPPAALRGSKAAKFKAWAAGAEKLGYDPVKLLKEVDRLCPRSN
jgi:hypothetical protein